MNRLFLYWPCYRFEVSCIGPETRIFFFHYFNRKNWFLDPTNHSTPLQILKYKTVKNNCCSTNTDCLILPACTVDRSSCIAGGGSIMIVISFVYIVNSVTSYRPYMSYYYTKRVHSYMY